MVFQGKIIVSPAVHGNQDADCELMEYANTLTVMIHAKIISTPAWAQNKARSFVNETVKISGAFRPENAKASDSMC